MSFFDVDLDVQYDDGYDEGQGNHPLFGDLFGTRAIKMGRLAFDRGFADGENDLQNEVDGILAGDVGFSPDEVEDLEFGPVEIIDSPEFSDGDFGDIDE